MSLNSSPVQTVQRNTWTSGTSFTITVAAPGDGNMGIICFAYNIPGTVGVSSISQTGATWVQSVLNTTTKDVEIWTTVGGVFASAGTTITVNLTGTPAVDGVIDGIFVEWADGAGSMSGYVIDGTHTNSGTSTNPATGNATPANSGRNALAIAAFKCANTTSAGPTNGFTDIAAANSQPGTFRAPYLVIASTTGSYATDYTVSGGAWGAAIAIIEAPSAGANIEDDDYGDAAFSPPVVWPDTTVATVFQ